MIGRPPRSPLFPYPPLSRSSVLLVWGPPAASPEVTGTPATTRLSNVEPLALLAAPLAVRLLTTLATKPSAVIRPFRMLMAAAVAVLCAPASAVPNAPLVVLLRNSVDSVPGTPDASASANAMSPSVPLTAGSTARGDWPSEAAGVLTYVPYAWPPTD